MNRESVVFCLAALAVTVMLSAVGFRLAALPPEAVAAAKRPTPPEKLPDLDLGGGFGRVSVIELTAYYVENPPAARAQAAAATPSVRRFGGC
ncbi:MAG: hypothetical protein NZL99_07910 [Burkholderiaceae bacterium]|nr:hypothetical protein [Burkholderiaceae bacterium]